MWTSEEDRLWSTRPLRCDKAWNTEFTLWYHFTKFFGLRGRDEHRQLKFGDIELVTTMQSRKYLAFNERTTKTQDGVNADDRRETKPKLNSTGSDRDPVAVFGKFVAKRPTSMNTPDSPFYLTVIRGHTTAKEEWFDPKPMGKKTLGDMMGKAAENAGLEKKTNHPARKSTVRTLRKAGVHPNRVMKVGHRCYYKPVYNALAAPVPKPLTGKPWILNIENMQHTCICSTRPHH